MKRKFIILIFLLIASINFVFSASDLPDWKDKYMNDFAGIFSPAQVNEMKNLLTSVDSDTTAEIVFVSDNECTSKGGPGQYALDLFTKWKIGKSDKDNGLLVLYCKDENKIWVTTGYGLEGILPDSMVGRMLDDYYVPLRDDGNVSLGIISFVEQIALVIYDNKEEVISGNAGGSAFSLLSIIIWMVIIALIIILRAKRLKRPGKRTSLWWIPIFLPSHGGGGFGGGGFGGGGSGGGGAGR